MNRRWLLVLALFAAACEHSQAHYIKGPDGDQWFEIDCRDDVHYCRTKAAEVCPSGYVTADTESHTRMGRLASSEMIKCR